MGHDVDYEFWIDEMSEEDVKKLRKFLIEMEGNYFGDEGDCFKVNLHHSYGFDLGKQLEKDKMNFKDLRICAYYLEREPDKEWNW